MELKGKELAEIRQAIVRAFTSSELDRFLSDRLNFERRVEIADGPFVQVVDQTLHHFLQRGLEWQLLYEVALVRPAKQEVQDVFRKYAQSVMTEGQRAAVADNVKLAYEGLGLAPPVYVQNKGVAQGKESTSLAGFQSIVNQSVQNIDGEQWRELWRRREHCVCRVDVDGAPSGTGFLVGPQVVLTNYHVVENKILTNTSNGIELRFGYKKLANVEVAPGLAVKAHPTDWLVASSRPSPGEDAGTPDNPPPTADQLDFALIRLATAFGSAPLTEVPGAPTRGWIEIAATPPPIHQAMGLLILQHPRAAPLQLAMDQTAITSTGPLRIRYTTNTERGSSGSPCFNYDWNLVALHHYGDPAYKNPVYNQGIPIAAIRAQLAALDKLGDLG